MSAGSVDTVAQDMHIPATLVEALRARRVVPFVGAGVSRAVVRKGAGAQGPLFPSWSELLVRAADALDLDGRPGEAMAIRGQLKKSKPDYLLAAKEARDGLGARWTDFLKNEIDLLLDDAAPESFRLATALWRLGSPLLVTTNYDHVLKWTCPQPAGYANWLTNPQAELAQLHKALGSLPPGTWPKRPTVWHLHGHIDHAADLVLTPDGYERLYPTTPHIQDSCKAALQTLKTLLLCRVFLFVGFSLDDVAFLGVLKDIQHDYSNCGETHYALIRESERAKIEERIGNLPIRLLPFRDFGEPLLQRVLGLSSSIGESSSGSAVARTDEIKTLAHAISPSLAHASGTSSQTAVLSDARAMTAHDPYDQLAEHFLELAPDQRREIARQLGLLPANHLSLSRIELSQQVFLAANSQRLLASLWTAVEERHPEGKPTPNPFST